MTHVTTTAYAALAALLTMTTATPTAFAECEHFLESSPAQTAAFHIAPTDTAHFMLRQATGTYLAGRASGVHAGVDIVATGSSTDKGLFRVVATGGSIVAFAGNSDPNGYGYTVILDHGNGEYTLYAHLAENASRPCVKLGQAVHEGQVIGYVFDPLTGETSSGNARAKTGVPAWERLQVHVELIHAASGIRSTSSSAPIKAGARIEDPTSRLVAAGYRGQGGDMAPPAAPSAIIVR